MLNIQAPRRLCILLLSVLVFLVSACITNISSAMDESIKQASLHISPINIEKVKNTEPATDRCEARNFYKKANQYFDEKYYDEAIANYRKAIALEPTFTPAYYNLGMVHVAMGHRKEAAGYLSTFLDLRPHAVNADELRLLIQSLHQ